MKIGKKTFIAAIFLLAELLFPSCLAAHGGRVSSRSGRDRGAQFAGRRGGWRRGRGAWNGRYSRRGRNWYGNNNYYHGSYWGPYWGYYGYPYYSDYGPYGGTGFGFGIYI